ncbi:MAG: ABC transporter substrate-binding protein, partial [Promethearchaeota archaeon]
MEMEKKNIAIIVLAIALVASGVGNVIFAIAGESIYGGDKEILRVWDSSTPRTLDPVDSWDSQSNAIIDQVTEGLFWVDIVSPESPDESLDVIPKLAESYSWNEDGDILTITLREGVYFHDGELCDADAVVKSLERLMFLTNQTGTLEDADQLAYTESLYHSSDKEQTPMMKEVTKLGDYNLTIELNDPFGAFIPLLAYTSSNIVSPNTPQEELLDLTEDTLVGTGPFEFEYYRVETEVRFSRFQNWWGGVLWNGEAPVEGEPYYGPSVGGPYYDEMVYIYYEDSSTGSSAMLAGDVDAGGVISEDLETAKDDDDLTYQEWGVGLAYYYVAFREDAIPL